MEAVASSRRDMKPERFSQHWYLTTVLKSGSDRVITASNLLSNVVNQSRGGGLTEPFPWTVIQGVIHVFIIIHNQL